MWMQFLYFWIYFVLQLHSLLNIVQIEMHNFFFMNFLYEIESQISRRFFRTVKSLFFGPFSYFFVVFFGVIFQVVISAINSSISWYTKSSMMFSFRFFDILTFHYAPILCFLSFFFIFYKFICAQKEQRIFFCFVNWRTSLPFTFHLCFKRSSEMSNVLTDVF